MRKAITTYTIFSQNYCNIISIAMAALLISQTRDVFRITGKTFLKIMQITSHTYRELYFLKETCKCIWETGKDEEQEEERT